MGWCVHAGTLHWWYDGFNFLGSFSETEWTSSCWNIKSRKKLKPPCLQVTVQKKRNLVRMEMEAIASLHIIRTVRWRKVLTQISINLKREVMQEDTYFLTWTQPHVCYMWRSSNLDKLGIGSLKVFLIVCFSLADHVPLYNCAGELCQGKDLNVLPRGASAGRWSTCQARLSHKALSINI